MHGDEGQRCGSCDRRREIGGIGCSLRGQPRLRAVTVIVGALWLLLLLVMDSDFEVSMLPNRVRPQNHCTLALSTAITVNKDNLFEPL